jgi:hypothetical protein
MIDSYTIFGITYKNHINKAMDVMKTYLEQNHEED